VLISLTRRNTTPSNPMMSPVSVVLQLREGGGPTNRLLSASAAETCEERSSLHRHVPRVRHGTAGLFSNHHGFASVLTRA